MFTIQQIIEATGAKLIQGQVQIQVAGVSTDSRSIKRGELFIAIKGERWDGHNFIQSAWRRGAAAVLFTHFRPAVSKLGPKLKSSLPLLQVKSSVQALGDLAAEYRRRFNLPLLAITGSNGKTTTKEMLSRILSRKFNVLSNPGTENNQIGVSLAILRLNPRHNCALLEIGANHAGEINRLAWIAQPTIGLITNIGPSHLEFFGDLKGVFAAKLELLKHLAPQAKLIVNQDDKFLSRLQESTWPIITFGLNRQADFFAEHIQQSKGKFQFLLNAKHKIVLPTLGRHNVYNALAAIAAARTLTVPYPAIKTALAGFKPPNMRMQMLKIDNIQVIKDCYNANPASFASALDFLRDCYFSGRKIVVCGDMLELGRRGAQLHFAVGQRIGQEHIDSLITVGRLARNVAQGARISGMSPKAIRTFGDIQEAAKFLRKIVNRGDLILVKGSRGMHMEKVIDAL